MRLAAIDIGSNACRLLINDVVESEGKTDFIKLNLIRIPLRLGIDVYDKQIISSERRQMLIESIQAFKHIMAAYQVDHFQAIATAAMREALNGLEIAEKVYELTGIKIDIIDGTQEAQLISQQIFQYSPWQQSPAQIITIDVGGGSTEVSAYLAQEILHQHSFNIGSIRLLNKQVSEADWKNFKNVLKNIKTEKKAPIKVIGTGGNINKVFSLSHQNDQTALDLTTLLSYYNRLKRLSITERMNKFKLKEDRADVIVPALKIYITALNELGISRIWVPKLGLTDGIIKHLYNNLKY